MYISGMFIPTLREAPADAEGIVYQLMLRAGLVRKVSSGIFNYLPLGLKVLRKIESLIKDEMEAIGLQEVMTSTLLPGERYREAGRYNSLSCEMFRLKDNAGRELSLALAHEEIFTDLIRNDARSYKAYPIGLYNIQAKYRDERRPRLGVMRSRVFTTMDACSFDIDNERQRLLYSKMHNAFKNVFNKCGLKYDMAESSWEKDKEALSHDFVVKSPVGETGLVYCSSCGYIANASKSPCVPKYGDKEEYKDIQKVATPDARTIEDLIKFFNTDSSRLAKTLIYKIGSKTVAAMVRGDRELNIHKLGALMNTQDIEMADAETVSRVTHAEVGFAGPVGIEVDMLVVDNEVAAANNLIVGANDTGYHLINVNYGRDFKADTVGDIRNITDGDKCPKCGEMAAVKYGMKIAGTSNMGNDYTKAMHAYCIDESGNEKFPLISSYSIGIDRVIAAIIEQHHDNDGIVWPMDAAPYEVIVIPAVATNEEQMKLSIEICDRLKELKIHLLLDDRNERAGVKFKDADLIGIPIRITVGKKAAEGIVEYKLRREGTLEEIRVEEMYSRILGEINYRG